MSKTMNQVVIMGNLTEDPDVHEVPSGRLVANLRVATALRSSKKDDNNGETPCYVDVAAWGKQAEACGKFLAKGHLVLVEGSLWYSEWETQEGEKRNKLSIRANSVHFLYGKKKGVAKAEALPETAKSVDF